MNTIAQNLIVIQAHRQEYYKTLQSYSAKQDLKQTVRFLVKQYNKTLKQVTTKRLSKK